jgi:hypothetical protein
MTSNGALERENDVLREVVAKYHHWLERVEALRDKNAVSYIGLDHAIGENVEGCSGCAALAQGAGPCRNTASCCFS